MSFHLIAFSLLASLLIETDAIQELGKNHFLEQKNEAHSPNEPCGYSHCLRVACGFCHRHFEQAQRWDSVAEAAQFDKAHQLEPAIGWRSHT